MDRHDRGARVGVVVVFVALLVALTSAAADAGNLDRYLKKQMRKARVPGLATAIVVDDELVQAAGYGWANPEEEMVVTPDTLFLIASVSKPLTATIAMRLVDRKRLELDANVNRYLPFEVRNPDFPDEAITLRQLLTHTSSINDAGYYERLDELVSFGDWPGSLTQFLTDYLTPGGRYYAAETSFRAARPGTSAEYSNVGFALVGAVVESVAGTSFETVSQELLFQPLDMGEASWSLSNLDVDQVAVPCTWTGGGYEAYPHLGTAAVPAGQLRTSAVQLANFARLHLAEGRFEGRRILKRKTAKQMVSVQWSAADTDLGFSFYLTQDDDRRIAYHGGGFTGTATHLWLGLDEGIGVVMLTNGEPFVHGESAVRAFFKIRDRLIKEGRRIASRALDPTSPLPSGATITRTDLGGTGSSTSGPGF